MPDVEFTIPDHVDMRIAQLVEEGEFLDREEAVRELLSTGIMAHKASGTQGDELDDTGEELMGREDEYVF